ncbi:unnamed protein product [Psylliodes chrysocephalus]|uniref:Uncharacterized protein n=1 Tax=Psylliodes chrysocephalus TaxID=3402493 RepID=A0A9P0CPP8_9CUCU|nr:unnamed protein product [Psylliodes chrysocephala]
MDTFETALLTIIWARILKRVNATSKTLETEDLNVSFGVELMTFPLTFVGEIRNKFDEIKIEAKTFCEGENISNIFFKEQRKTIFDETGERETILKGKDVICDNIFQRELNATKK